MTAVVGQHPLGGFHAVTDRGVRILVLCRLAFVTGSVFEGNDWTWLDGLVHDARLPSRCYMETQSIALSKCICGENGFIAVKY